MKHRSFIAVAGALGTSVFVAEAWAQADVSADAPEPQAATPPASTQAPVPPPVQTAGPQAPSPAEARAAWEAGRAYAAWQYQYAAWLAAQQRPPQRRWYGWQTLVSDGISVALVIGGAAADSGPRSSRDMAGFLLAGGFLSFPIVPPVIHLFHGNGGKAAVSAGLRLGSTLLLFLGALECGNSSRRCEDGYGVMAFIGAIGLPTAVIVDAAIAFEDVEPGEEARLTLAPWVTPVRGGGAAGLRGVF